MKEVRETLEQETEREPFGLEDWSETLGLKTEGAHPGLGWKTVMDTLELKTEYELPSPIQSESQVCNGESISFQTFLHLLRTGLYSCEDG